MSRQVWREQRKNRRQGMGVAQFPSIGESEAGEAGERQKRHRGREKDRD